MTKRMLIDATQPEETRVAVAENDRLDSYDFDSAARKQIKGNIFLAKVTRVEPSLQACFVEYGGNRQGFLAFTEIHPDYYRIPVEDRQALLAEEAGWSEEEDEEEDEFKAPGQEEQPDIQLDAAGTAEGYSADFPAENGDLGAMEMPLEAAQTHQTVSGEVYAEQMNEDVTVPEAGNLTEVARDDTIESVGGAEEEVTETRNARRIGKLRRRYKIQEVIKRRQIMLVQATKEERGGKGAAMTTYISLPGRYCVLMPNSPRGGGVSRKITDPQARRKMKDLLSELEVPGGMSVILRTAGMTRTRIEVKRDLEYLLRLWDEIRRETLKSEAPAMVYEEADIFKRVIRDLYSGDTQEIIVAGDLGFTKVKTFMRQMVPTHAKRVFFYRDPLIPLFQRFGIEAQIADIFNPRVELKSGGYIIINPTEALVSIDVNSGRATRERHIDDTALKTNIEAAEEIARQLRLRDLGGLVVIDFIDMESGRHNAKVERKLREAMAEDRARIEIGRISGFGLLELSRQRLHPSLTETHFEPCAHCGATGIVRTTESAAVVVMRAIEAEAVRGRATAITATIPSSVAIYLLNHKREDINRIEEYFGCRVSLRADEDLMPNDVQINYEKGTPQPRKQAPLLPVPVLEGTDDDYINADEEDNGEPLMSNALAGEEGSEARTNTRRRRTGGRGEGRGESRGEGRGEGRGEREGGREGGGRERFERRPRGEARQIPITEGESAIGDGLETGPEAVMNPSDPEAAGKSRRSRSQRGRHPYQRRRNGERNGERGQPGGEQPDVPADFVPVKQQGETNLSSSQNNAQDNDKPAPAEKTGKKGWWQKLIE
ncbi:MAG: ribonuclease, Rne/Rng domain protein [Alphaproteobacteria bacterium]|nr:ribonuclease, Rne/Rng domain protein [Alphaproteobacteria bacterium]